MSVRSAFLTPDHPALSHLAKRDARLKWVIARLGGLRVRGVRSPSEHMICTIVGQMISTTAGNAVIARLETLCGGPLTAARISRFDPGALRGCGLSTRKAKYIAEFARYVTENPCFLRDLENCPDEEALARLTALPGIGPWSAKMHLIFVLGRENVLPFEDGAFAQGFRKLYGQEPTKEHALARARRWSPYASYAARLIYRALDSGLLDEPHT